MRTTQLSSAQHRLAETADEAFEAVKSACQRLLAQCSYLTDRVEDLERSSPSEEAVKLVDAVVVPRFEELASALKTRVKHLASRGRRGAQTTHASDSETSEYEEEGSPLGETKQAATAARRRRAAPRKADVAASVSAGDSLDLPVLASALQRTPLPQGSESLPSSPARAGEAVSSGYHGEGTTEEPRYLHLMQALQEKVAGVAARVQAVEHCCSRDSQTQEAGLKALRKGVAELRSQCQQKVQDTQAYARKLGEDVLLTLQVPWN